jgi:hypothetical protein
LPPALASRPWVTVDIQFYLSAFFFLTRFRGSNGFGLNPLAFADVDRYAIMSGYADPEDRLFFAEVMNECDHIYLEKERKKQEAKKKQDEAKSKLKSKRR